VITAIEAQYLGTSGHGWAKIKGGLCPILSTTRSTTYAIPPFREFLRVVLPLI
jgi:hypothetical protein